MLLPASDQTATQAANAAAVAACRVKFLGVVRRSLIAYVLSRRKAGSTGSIPGMSEVPRPMLSTGAASFHIAAGSQARHARAGCGIAGLTAQDGRKDNPSVDLRWRARDGARGRARQRASRQQEENGERHVSAQRVV